jgi:prepilin-type N-terminal cleavage/methylation domain-containing protein
MKYITKQSGFSLVETLVAITILLIVIVGPMTIVSSAARSTSFASEQVTAFFLAQEGAELVEKARNDLLLEYFANANPGNDPWADFTNITTTGFFRRCYRNPSTNPITNPNGCAFDVSPVGKLNPPISCNTIADCNLFLNTSTSVSRSRYSLNRTGNASTQFTRQIILERSAAYPNEVKVTSRVTWRSGSVREDQVVNVETRLFNLYESN